MESPVKSSPVKQTSILRYMSPQKSQSEAQPGSQKSTAQSEAREHTGTPEPRESVPPRVTLHHHLGDGAAVVQSERVTTSDDVTAEADDVSDNACAVASDKGDDVEADWETCMEADWNDGDVDDADLLNQNEEEEEEEEPWLCAKRRKL